MNHTQPEHNSLGQVIGDAVPNWQPVAHLSKGAASQYSPQKARQFAGLY